MAQQFTINMHNNAPLLSKTAIRNNKVVYNFSYPGIILKEVNTNRGVFNQLVVPQTYRSGKIGEPQLVSTQKLISIPTNSQVKVKVVGYTTDEFIIDEYFADNKLIPYQPSYSKSEDIQEKELIVKSDAYKQNSFNKVNIASVKVLGVMRDKTIAKLTINPVAYNPSTNTIRFYNNIEVEVSIVKNRKAEPVKSKAVYSPYFSNRFQKIEPLVAPSSYTDNPDLVKHPVKYLIVTPNNYIDELHDFIEWKTQKGFNIVVGNLDKIGSTASEIKTWVHDQYNNATEASPAPSFLLLVGDVQQIPVSQNGGRTGMVTDLYYASVDGDMFPDMYYGRIPAQNTTQLRAMIDKILYYEKYQFADDSFLNDVTLIAGADGSYNTRVGQPTVNYGTNYYFNATNGFNNVNAYLSSYSGCYASDKIAVSMINYTAHCSSTSWANPSLGVSTVNAFTNQGKYPVAIGNCCNSGNFSTSECIGEAWVRNPNGGAIAYLGSVPETYWYEDFYWAVGAHSPVNNQYPTTDESSVGVYDAPFVSDYNTVDAMIFVGNLAVTEAHNEGYNSDISSQYYWEAYHCFGDPSLVSYLTKGTNNKVTHDTVFPYGVNEFWVKAVPGSQVALSNTNGLIGTAISNNDSIAKIATDTLSTIDSVTIVVTKSQYKPYIKKIPIKVQGTYLIVESFKVEDGSWNSNGKIDFGEQANIELFIKNIGDKTAKNIQVSLTSNSNYLLSIADNINVSVDSIKANETIALTNHFFIKIKDSVPDQTAINFSVLLSDSVSREARDYYNSSIDDKINAPVLKVLPYQYLNDFETNGNNIIDYGETANLQVAIVNQGHVQVSSTVSLSNVSENETLILNTTQIELNKFALNDTVLVNFEINLPENAVAKPADTLICKIERGVYLSQQQKIVDLGQNLFVELGSDNNIENDYPLNNLYKNNTTQILYLNSEIGSDFKAVKSIAFNIADFTADLNNRDLNNFKIKAAFTDISELTGGVELENPQELLNNNLYNLPASVGWETFELQQPMILSNGKNIIFEISWGTTDSYASQGDNTTLYSTATSYKSVAWGASNSIYPAPVENTSYYRPNTQFEFDTVGILNISVQGDLPVKSSQYVEDFKVSINSESQFTNELGQAQFCFLEYTGSYNIGFSGYGYRDTTVTFNKTQTYDHYSIELKRNPELTITVQNNSGVFVADALVTIGSQSFTTNSVGQIVCYSTPISQYAVFTVSGNGYTTVTDSLLMNSAEQSTLVILQNDYADVTVYVVNTDSEPVSGVNVRISLQSETTDADGMATFADINEGYYLLQLYHPNYAYAFDTIKILQNDTILYYTVKIERDIAINVSDGTKPLPDIKVKLGSFAQTSNSEGVAMFSHIVEGEYTITIDDSNYYSYSGIIEVTKNTTFADVDLQSIADIKFFVKDGFVGIGNAVVKFDTLTANTDTNGYAQFNNIIDGTYYYSIKADGFYQYIDSVKVGYPDTILNIKMDFIPDLILEIEAPDIAVGEIPVYFENDTLFADNYGFIEIKDIGAGTFHYSINKTGFYEIADSVTITTNNVSKIITLKPMPEVKFAIWDNNYVLDSVLVTFGDKSAYTDMLGELYFTDVAKGEYDYNLEKQGYFSKNGTVQVFDNDTAFNFNLQQIPDVHFTVVYNNEPVENAQIKIDTFTLFTNANGKCVANNLSVGNYEYTVEKAGFIPYTDTAVVGVVDVYEAIELQPQQFDVIFTVTNGTEPLENSLILFNGVEKVTDQNGIAVFNNIVPNNNYPYNISSSGYFDYFDVLDVIDENVSVQIEMILEAYNVLFNVSDNNGVVEGANITFDNKVKSTNSSGGAVFTNVLPANNLPYYIQKAETHLPDTGYINLTNDTTINITLIALAINDNMLMFKIYPNPTQGKLFINAGKNLIGSQYQILNNEGKVVLKGKITELPQTINLINEPQGIFHIHLIVGNKTIIRSIVLQ